MVAFYEYVFYCIYLGFKTPGKKRSTNRKTDAVTLFCALSAFYAVNIFVITLISLRSVLPPINKLVITIGVFGIGILFWYIPQKYFTYSKIEEIKTVYEGKISLAKARTIKRCLTLSIAVTVATLILILRS